MMISKRGNGFSIGKYVFDSNSYSPNEIIFVSHAHEDHLPSKKAKVLASSLTIEIANIRKNKELLKEGTYKWTNENYALYDAGHVPGSKMIELRIDDLKILYTGDFSLHSNPLVRSEFPKHKVDILILDATYFFPFYSLPEPKEVIEEIIEYIYSNPDSPLYFFLYPYGKSQVLGSYFDKYGIEYYFHKDFEEMNKIVEKHTGHVFNGKYVSLKEVLHRKKGVFILPLKYRNNITKGIKIGVSGWGKNPYYAKRMGLDIVFPYSDHADFEDLLYFIEKTQPEVVYGIQLNGNKNFFKQYLREEYGIYADEIK